jgi:lipopolysaccharide transport system ATP-binding protein
MKVAVKIENVSKQYRLGLIGTGTISHDLNRWWHLVRGKEDPYIRIGDTNDRSTTGSSDYVWALKNINLEVEQGEVLGIIGKNGAGKSTLLKILSKVTAPSTGKISYRGRIGALLEVGTGFHPELTGRENIFLNGAILGMRKKEINRKFDEIVDFSGCIRYIDTPVKRYSSGMTVRLGFAVAAFLEPEILVVDEVLAVGDADFQKKAIGKMQDVSRNDGRTVLFVSHNMTAMKNLCRKGVLIENGMIKYQSDIDSTVEAYLKNQELNHSAEIATMTDRQGNGILLFSDAQLYDKNGIECGDFLCGEPMLLKVYYDKKISDSDIYNSRIDICINDHMGSVVTWLSTSIFKSNAIIKSDHVVFSIERLMLNHGIYDFTLYCQVNNQLADRVQNVKKFNVLFNDYYKTGKEILSGQCSLVSDFSIK